MAGTTVRSAHSGVASSEHTSTCVGLQPGFRMHVDIRSSGTGVGLVYTGSR